MELDVTIKITKKTVQDIGGEDAQELLGWLLQESDTSDGELVAVIHEWATQSLNNNQLEYFSTLLLRAAGHELELPAGSENKGVDEDIDDLDV